MSSTGTPPPATLRPSVFISYASEDRTAARRLRDYLSAAGLEVWYDENELGGGDAWDQKIRRQIRDCDYFLPIVSATTQRRKEGYFRREWRLAAERTLDMADDVLFLLPVSIDDTNETVARVPDKFLTVQWLRLPGGKPEAALDALIKRLLAGEHTITTRPPMIIRPPAGSGMGWPHPETDDSAPPRMPAFPHAPEYGGVGNWMRYIAEVIWWGVTATWILFSRLPRWVRIMVSMWFVVTLITTCGRINWSKSKETTPPVVPTAPAGKRPGKGGPGREKQPGDVAKFGEDITRQLAPLISAAEATRKQIVLVAFGGDITDEATVQFAKSTFRTCSQLIDRARPNDTAVLHTKIGRTDEAAAAFGRKLEIGFLLVAREGKVDDKPALAVRLIKVGDGTVAWSNDFPIDTVNASEAATRIADAVLTTVPAKHEK